MSDKPDWRKGDVIIGRGGVLGTPHIATGGMVPDRPETRWLNIILSGFRRATAADIDCAVADERREIERHTRELERLEAMRAKLTEDAR